MGTDCTITDCYTCPYDITVIAIANLAYLAEGFVFLIHDMIFPAKARRNFYDSSRAKHVHVAQDQSKRRAIWNNYSEGAWVTTGGKERKDLKIVRSMGKFNPHGWSAPCFKALDKLLYAAYTIYIK